jgi:S1-C subfamily serine protease
MKLRRVVLVVLLVGGFWYLTTHLPAGMGRFWPFGAHGSSSPLQLTEAEAAPAYDPEELNNIAVYKRVLPSVVNITSTTLVFNFFYGAVPQHGQGSGFILDKAGHVLTNFHVVDGANRGIEVMLSNKRRYAAKVVGTDKSTIWPCCRLKRPTWSRSRWPTPPISPSARRSTPSAILSASAAP